MAYACMPNWRALMSIDLIAADQLFGHAPAIGERATEELKYRIHGRLVQQLDLAEVRKLPDQNLRGELRLVVVRFLAAEDASLSPETRERLIEEILDELV